MINIIEFLRNRRSAPSLYAPGPSLDQIKTMVDCANSVPDHGLLQPWRFIVFNECDRDLLANLFADSMASTPSEYGGWRSKAFRAPTILVAICSPTKESRVPEIEQVISSGLAAYTVMLAASAMGFGCYWRTGDPAYNPKLVATLGLSTDEKIIGFLFFGTPISTKHSIRKKYLGRMPLTSAASLEKLKSLAEA